MARLLMLTGRPLREVVGLDVLTFNAMIALMTRARYQDKAEDAWTTAMSVNSGMSGNTEALAERTRKWMTLGEEDPTKVLAYGKKTARDFLSDFKLGRGGRI